MGRSKFPRWALPGLLLMFILAMSGGLWHLDRSPQPRYLPVDGPAEWIAYPISIDLVWVAAADLTTEFRLPFHIEKVPDRANLRVRGSQGFDVWVNGQLVHCSPLEATAPDWKKETELEVASQLHEGTNELVVNVTNKVGPPALWLTLEAGPVRVVSDANWECSTAGATWVKARPTAGGAQPRPGNHADSEFRTGVALQDRWQSLLAFALASAAVFMGGSRFIAKRGLHLPGNHLPFWPVLAVIASLRVGLFVIDEPSLIAPIGFDASAHIDYVAYVLDNGTLPLANDGWEMFQPPLYYSVSAALLWLTATPPNGEPCLLALRVINLILGLVGVYLTALCLRRLFPAREAPWLIGVVVAGALPLSVYHTFYPGNDLMVGVFGSAAFYLTLMVLQDGPPSWKLLTALGACLGAAVLTKLSAVPVVAAILGALATAALLRDRSLLAVARLAGIPSLVALLLCGWHFYRNYLAFGQPIVGNFDPVSGHKWWAHPGQTEASDFFRFGRVLSSPFQAAFASVPDGLYSTLWGDGSWGGNFGHLRPPWDYQLMAAGYILAVVPTFLIAFGFMAVFVDWFRRPTAEWGLVLAVTVAAAAAFVYQHTHYPYHGGATTRYLLPAIICVCVYASRGFEQISSWSKRLSVGLGIAMGAWALTAFASFLVPPTSPDTLAWIGELRLASNNLAEAKRCANQAMGQDERNPNVQRLLGNILLRTNRPGEAADRFRQVLAARPELSQVRVSLAQALMRQNQSDQAIRELREVIRQAPDNIDAYIPLAALLETKSEFAAVVEVAREGLRVRPMSSELHFSLARGLLRLNRTSDAITHFRLALRYPPGEPKLELLDALAVAYAQAGRFPEAAATAQQALVLAATRDEIELSHLLRTRIEGYNSAARAP
jgi:tetratricopeptide (TPR) repeat protein